MSTQTMSAQTGPVGAPTVLPTRLDDVPRGVLLMIGATLLLAAANALGKHLVALYPIGEVMFFRSGAAFAVCCAFVLPRSGLAVFATKRPRDHVARGVSQAISQTLTVAALGLMPIAGVMAIGFSAPLWAALVAAIIYKEATDPSRWAFLLLGFAGVLVVTHPGADSLSLGALFALGNAVMYGSVTVAVRGMTKTESSRTLLMWQMAVMTVCHAGLLPFGFTLPTLADLALLAVLGLTNAGAQYLWTKALSLAPASAVSPFYYFMLVWGIALGFLFWGEVPSLTLVAGSLVVIVSGLCLLWHETGRSAGTLSRFGALVATLRQLWTARPETTASRRPC